jgi:hypothetical protein
VKNDEVHVMFMLATLASDMGDSDGCDEEKRVAAKEELVGVPPVVPAPTAAAAAAADSAPFRGVDEEDEKLMLFRGSTKGDPRSCAITWNKHDSVARSQACHSGCVEESGSGG